MIDLIKREAIKAVNATNPVGVIFGTVISENPLKIQVHQKLILTKEFLVITERVTKYEVDLTHNHGGSSALNDKLKGDYPIRFGLLKNDKVVLLKVQGGSQYVVLDKVVG